MIAAPPGRGPWTNRDWLLGIGVYLVATPAGALLTAALLYVAGRAIGHPAGSIAGIVALAAGIAGSGVFPLRYPSSRWQIPRRWGSLGHVTYSAIFGGILGLGFLTVIPSIGFYALVAWALASGSWGRIAVVYVIFGLSRALPLMVLAWGAQRRREYPTQVLERFIAVARRVAPAEIALLVVIGVALLAGTSP